jgi:hypothetical protein
MWKFIGIAAVIILTTIYTNHLIYEQCNTRGWASLSQGQIVCFPSIDAHLGNTKK